MASGVVFCLNAVKNHSSQNSRNKHGYRRSWDITVYDHKYFSLTVHNDIVTKLSVGYSNYVSQDKLNISASNKAVFNI